MVSIEENVSLAPYTTFRLGGAARFFARAASIEDIREACSFATEKKLPLLFLGGGSNMLIGDRGFEGLALKIEIPGISFQPEKNGALLIASAGESWDGIVSRSIEEGLCGLENLSGIPGTVGGAVVQNIGAYGAALSQRCTWAEVYDYAADEVRMLSTEECAFDYRDSIFKHTDRYVVVRAAFRLTEKESFDISYKDLAERFPEGAPDVRAVREAVLDIRKGKFPNLSEEGTAGSFFKNPIVSEEEGQRLQRDMPGLPLFALPETGGVKVPLAYLIDKGLSLKGFSVGGARLFEKQPLVIAASFSASSKDVIELARAVREKVRAYCGIDIEPEVKIIS